MLNRLSSTCTISLALAALLSCSAPETKNEHTDNAIGKPAVYFFHGDPESLLEDTSPNPNSPFNSSNLEAFKDFNISKFLIFRSTSPLESTSEEAETSDAAPVASENEIVDESRIEEDQIPNYEFQQMEGNFFYKNAGNLKLPSLEFALQQDRLELRKLILLDGKTIEIKAKHYSISQDSDLFSILFSFREHDSDHLGAIYFTKNQTPMTKVKTTDGDYPYLFGRDIAVGWQKPLNLSICGKRALAERDMIEEAIKKWDETSNMHFGGLPYTIQSLDNALPFSDVNQNCIFLVNDYRLTASFEKLALGVAFPVVNATRAQLVAGSIVIFENAHYQFNPHHPIKQTMLHELGHLLGLGHEFKKDDNGNAIYTSVMSYEHVDEIQKRDLEAVGALYSELASSQAVSATDEFDEDEASSSDSTSLIYSLFSPY